jgi:hypothetical protein
LKRKKEDSSGESDNEREKEVEGILQRSMAVPGPSNVETSSLPENICDNDLGKWVGRTSLMTTSQKLDILKRCWVPPENYNFAQDAEAAQLKRKFNYDWLKTYAPWLVYSKHLRGALCLYCVLFPPKIVAGILGSFVTRSFNRFKNIHEYCNKHVSSQYHQSAVIDAKNFSEQMPVDVMMKTAHQKDIENNRKIMLSIISTIIFCGTHDMPLRGKENHQGVFEDLLKLSIESGDLTIKEHFETGKKNAMYTSPQIQNEIINLCGLVVKSEIIKAAKKAYAYSVMADETCDISGKEQLSIGIRFYDENINSIREEFLGFVELTAMDAKTIASIIDKFLENEGLESDSCVGQGYDGCSTMAGHIGGVQKILKEKYKKALYFHCASHRLNLVVNDLNQVPEIRNTIGTIKDIINFFRESSLRRKYVPNIPALCETRWSHKYKSIAIFNAHFEEIVKGLSDISREGNEASRKRAYQLHCAAVKSVFIICVQLIAKYSGILEPIANALQSKTIDMYVCMSHIKGIISVINDHRSNADIESQNILDTSIRIAAAFGTDIQVPRVVSRQQHRSNHPAETLCDFWKRSIIIPYFDSLISALEQRFGDQNLPAFGLLSLHPSTMLNMSLIDFKDRAQSFCLYYDLLNFNQEAELWYKKWQNKGMTREDLEKLDFTEVLKEANIFFPATKKAILISLALPCTTSNIERSFSTLRRVKTWLRSTMTENRLNGLCMLSVHRTMVQKTKDTIESEVLKRFCEEPRRLLFL